MTPAIVDRSIWVALSTGLAILFTVLYAFMDQVNARHSAVRKWWELVRSPGFIKILRLLYATSIPAVALFTQGALTYRGLGLKSLPRTQIAAQASNSWQTWQADAEVSATVCFVTFFILTAGIRRSGTHRPGDSPDPIMVIGNSFYEGFVNQIHWAFYRELFIFLWGIAFGSWLVVIPLTLELLLNPANWSEFKDQHGITRRLIQTAIFVASTIQFIQTQNLWLMLIADMLLRMSFYRYLFNTTSENQ
ncbi:MAG: hypothetical protein P1S60_03020 [Anaerolineae bacterium]|nr:hypothetical protein [Anaerolineae bacterium]